MHIDTNVPHSQVGRTPLLQLTSWGQSDAYLILYLQHRLMSQLMLGVSFTWQWWTLFDNEHPWPKCNLVNMLQPICNLELAISLSNFNVFRDKMILQILHLSGQFRISVPADLSYCFFKWARRHKTNGRRSKPKFHPPEAGLIFPIEVARRSIPVYYCWAG